MEIRLARTDELTTAELECIRHVCETAFGEREGPRPTRSLVFTAEDWDHTFGGVHVVALEEGAIVAHAAVIERELHVGGVVMRTGYVEAVATLPVHQRRGFGMAVMRAASDHIRSSFELGALDSSKHRFYERVAWERWRGPTWVRTAGGLERTEEEDPYVMILRTPTTPPIDLSSPISCDWRPGDVW